MHHSNGRNWQQLNTIQAHQELQVCRAHVILPNNDTRLRRVGIIPKKHILDVSESLKTIIQDEYKMKIELVSPGTHRRNAAEVAIRNFNAHFLSVLSRTAQDFPPSLWDRVLPQAEITINILRQSNETPNVLAYAHLSGPFDYNKFPLEPMGMSVKMYKNRQKRYMGIPYSRRLVFSDINWTLLYT